MAPPTPKPSAPQVQFLTVQEEWAGQRLDNFLFRTVKGVPKTHIYRLIRSGQVRINKGRAQADSRLAEGDVIRVPPVRHADEAKTATSAPQAPAKSFPILFEDDWLLAINKPAGVAVHGGSGVSFGVIEQLRAARPEARFLELVHRLDRETSGILLIAKKRSALTHVQNQFRERSTGKTYLSLVKGLWPANLKVIDTPLRKYLLADGERRVRPTNKDDAEGMRALSLVQVRQTFAAVPQHGLPATSLIEVTIKTGRTHQIRVHTANSGHPIAGDDKYGDFDWNKRLAKHGLGRMFLHAWRLRFTHPNNGQSIELLCEPGNDLFNPVDTPRTAN
ncbi:RluA family pseudouridine synthase [Lampropedia puyangensis]|uniref:Pseudouridine synthase n=1 Tax=Lampropedia puyangensis TaxID=1330072 RepID=A0A4S8F1R9_9BURK|nr:RluA family pseudouridine synthase [Lampropedia puyangensis]THU00641.1 RluA family pseudouridine synthase [Lampropedia puyangensis]